VYECTRNGFPEICLVDVDTRAVTALNLGGSSIQTAQQPAWSPDGLQIAYVERNRFTVGIINPTLAIAFVLKVYTVASAQVDVITSYDATSSDNPSAFYPSWSPQGTFLLFTKMTPQIGFGGARALRWDLAEISTNARNVRLNDPLVFAVTDAINAPAPGAARGHLSPEGDGRIVYMRLTEVQNLPPLQRLQNAEIRVLKGQLGLSRLLGSGNDPRWSPGGSYIAYSRYATPGNGATAQVVAVPFVADEAASSGDELKTSAEVLVTNGQQPDQQPSW
jgi:Tol biopolymer transport system component